VAKLPASSSLERGRPWHLVEHPRSPFRCDVCGATIPDHEASSFTTLPKMYYETPPAGYAPCNRASSPGSSPAGFDGLSADYDHVANGDPKTASSMPSHAPPDFGGRFVFTRTGDTMPAVYRVEVFLAGLPPVTTMLRWDESSRPQLEPPLADEWAQDETLKLARVLHKDPKPRLTRWRGRPS
jgi:hypothetical protein